MSNQEQDEIEQIRREINLLQNRLTKNEKSQTQFQKVLNRIKKIQIKKRQSKLRQNLFQTKKIYEIINLRNLKKDRTSWKKDRFYHKSC